MMYVDSSPTLIRGTVITDYEMIPPIPTLNTHFTVTRRPATQLYPEYSILCKRLHLLKLGSKFLVELRVLSVHRSTSMLTGKFCTNILYPYRKLLLYHNKKELPWFSALARNTV